VVVTGFPWKDSGGVFLSFGQSSSRPAGAEGRFTPKDAADRYILRKALNAESGDSLVLDLRRESAQAKARIALSSRRDGSSPVANASFPLSAEKAQLIIPFASKTRIVSLSLTAESGSFDLESVGVERASCVSPRASASRQWTGAKSSRSRRP